MPTLLETEETHWINQQIAALADALETRGDEVGSLPGYQPGYEAGYLAALIHIRGHRDGTYPLDLLE